ncbi:unnamed protein product [Trichogramma brassicae]|uniref:Uncharacterized protein n=1 Tax=Trichogramma brassicae TaxID=86971 RepID=A0A6H5HW88_9HYME|nr:unnamed protein product [Trichogramma brassicae]
MGTLRRQGKQLHTVRFCTHSKSTMKSVGAECAELVSLCITNVKYLDLYLNVPQVLRERLRTAQNLQDPVCAKVNKIRRSASGNLLLQLKKASGNTREMCRTLNEVLGELATTSARTRTILVEIRDLEDEAWKGSLLVAWRLTLSVLLDYQTHSLVSAKDSQLSTLKSFQSDWSFLKADKQGKDLKKTTNLIEFEPDFHCLNYVKSFLKISTTA